MKRRPRFDVGIAGVPLDTNVEAVPGQRYGPKAIREGNYLLPGAPLYRTSSDEWDGATVQDFGDSEPSMTSAVQLLEKMFTKSTFGITLGGDHSILYAITEALMMIDFDPITLVFIDAHADCYPKPNWLKISHGSMLTSICAHGWVKEIIFVGIRGYGPGPQQYNMLKTKQTYYTMESIRRSGIYEVTEQVEAQVASKPFYTSFDIDSVDPAFAPGTGTPEPGGLTSYEALSLVRALSQKPLMRGLDIVEVCPVRDLSGITAMLANRLMLEAIVARSNLH